MTDATFLDRFVVTVKQYNEEQDKQYLEYCDKCKANGVNPEPFSRYFQKFNYKTGYGLPGKYPKYARRKKDLI